MYILEGNIGAGKSTFLKVLQAHCADVLTAYEPLNEWYRHVEGQSLLTNFYADPQRWAYAMETFAMFCRVQEHTKDQRALELDPQARIIERSIYSGHYCFALNSYQNGFMTSLEWSMYNEWFNFLIPGNCKPPHGFIYLRVEPTTAFERIHKRQRAGEELIPLKYLEQLHECHENFLVKKQGILPELKDIPVLILDGALDFEGDSTDARLLIEQVAKFIEKTKPAELLANANSSVSAFSHMRTERQHGVLI